MKLLPLLWNKEIFGNIFKKKARLLRRIEGTQIALANNPCSSLAILEKNLNSELMALLQQEEEYWAAKSRIDWLKLGDANTSFFHASVIQ